MNIQLKKDLLVLVAETKDEIAQVGSWGTDCDDHVFALTVQHDRTLLLHDLGPRPDACREPINVVSTASDETVRLISNLAHTPFRLYGREYASVEGFWQGLKFSNEESRARIARLHGKQAKLAAHRAPATDMLSYQGARVRMGCPEHWALLQQACWAKFCQHAAARDALLSTGKRPLVHHVRRDSLIIPGVIMADIWMRIRARLRDARADMDSAEMIGPFDGPYRWLSNFYPASVML
ncbi:MAG: NADAR family protein, partial [Candidatus Competibacteraceae bacterium]